jgi:hypothetical protein
MDRSNLRLAAKLLSKAEGTEFEAESVALAEKAYVVLAEFLNGLEQPDSAEAGRRRERRLLRDRRATRRMFGRRAGAAGADAEATYGREARDRDGPPGDIDLRA